MMRSLSHWGMFHEPPPLELLFEQQLDDVLHTAEQVRIRIRCGDPINQTNRHAAFALAGVGQALEDHGRAQRDRSGAPKLYDSLF